jgi:hypothetical protein
MLEPAVHGGAMPMLDLRGNIDNVSGGQCPCRFSVLLIPAASPVTSRICPPLWWMCQALIVPGAKVTTPMPTPEVVSIFR